MDHDSKTTITLVWGTTSGNASVVLPLLPFWVYREEGTKKQTNHKKKQNKKEKPSSSLYTSYLSFVLSFNIHFVFLFLLLSLHHLFLSIFCFSSSFILSLVLTCSCHLFCFVFFFLTFTLPLLLRFSFFFYLLVFPQLLLFLLFLFFSILFGQASPETNLPPRKFWDKFYLPHPLKRGEKNQNSFGSATGIRSKLNISINQEQTQHNTKTTPQSRHKISPSQTKNTTSTDLLSGDVN